MNPLHGAVEGGRAETVRALLEFLAEDEQKKTALTTAKNSDEKTAWDLSVASKNQAICGILKDLGDPNAASAACVIC